jgi:hypothetical protein
MFSLLTGQTAPSQIGRAIRADINLFFIRMYAPTNLVRSLTAD